MSSGAELVMEAVRESFWLAKYLCRRLNPVTALKNWALGLTDWKKFFQARVRFNKMASGDRRAEIGFLRPCLGDDRNITPIEPIYFYQDAWAFEHIARIRPAQHIDIGSHHKYVALLSKIVPLTMVDIRPLSLALDTIHFKEGSILNLPYESESVASISSLCVIEHIGLGRYGDPLDPEGSEKAIDELKRVLAPRGSLFISVPIDDVNRTYFNAHRAFDEEYVLGRFAPLKVMERRYIYGDTFTDTRREGFGVACYWLSRT